MLYYDITDVSEGTDPAKSDSIKECIIPHYSFVNHGFKLQESVCNCCHVWTILCPSMRDTAIITVKNFDYCCIIHNISKSIAINLLKNHVLDHWGYIWKILPSVQSTHNSFFIFFVSW